MLQEKILTMNINSSTVAFINVDYLISDEKEINQDQLKNFIEDKKINLIITTRNKEELRFLRNIHIIKIDQKEDEESIYKANIEIQKHKGNFFYVLDNYIAMLKYIICLKITYNYISKTENLDKETKRIIQGFGLQSFFQSYQIYLSNIYLSNESTNISNIQIVQEQYKLPAPISIPEFKVEYDEKWIN
ncbi:unnamed protein product [Paramecium primaurelia]|uniref:Uncharacterized protein n=1 Tax=Paramecium primaurelia TaxID=5886 RepID=A0A8S1PM14_PARPR|nr:unnamed protein product [Paramecium primaurelia]